MSYFFFHHPLTARPPLPGRCPMDCIGTLVDTAGRVQRGASFAIPADGLAPNKFGDNVDPCPFASPLAVVHTFCRLDKRGGKFYVAPRANLAQSVKPGDVVIYGHLRTSRGQPHELYVDTVVVVERTADLPTMPPGVAGKAYHFETGPAFARAVLDSTPDVTSVAQWEQLQRSDLWKMNLKDVLPRGGHEHTAFRPHRIIVGSVAPKGAEGTALETRKTSYVPLVTAAPANGKALLPPVLTKSASCGTLWADLTAWVAVNPRMAVGNKPPTRMSTRLGKAIYDQIRALSGLGGPYPGHVAVPPVRWAAGGGAS